MHSRFITYICRQCKQGLSVFYKLRLKLLNTRCNLLFLALIFTAGGLFSCRPTRHVAENEYLLERYRVELPSKDIDRNELKDYVRQKPNKRILGMRFHLWLHNMANPAKPGWPHNWLRRIGEEPVIYDPFLTQRSVTQIEQYLRNKGYYSAEVEDTLRTRKKRAKITYLVNPQAAHHIVSVNYAINDRELRDIILEDTVNALIGPGSIFDVDMLQSERIRIENHLKNQGFFFFTREHIYFNADTTLGQMTVGLTMGISDYRKRLEDGRVVYTPHQKYRIGNVYVLPFYNPREAIDRQDDYYSDLDTVKFRDMHYLVRGEMPVSQRVIAQSNFILPGEYYNLENVDRTYRHLFALRQYRVVNIRFAEPPGNLPGTRSGGENMPGAISGEENIPGTLSEAEVSSGSLPGAEILFDSLHAVNIPDTLSRPVSGGQGNPGAGISGPLLDAWIQLTPFNMQSYTIELEGTNSSGDFGFGGNLIYQHRNIFGRAEILDFKIKGSLETLNEYYTRSYKNTYEYGAEAGLQIPRFLLPIRSISFVRRYNPRTNLSMAYSYQQRPDYTRTIANAAFGYSWRSSGFMTHIINPVELNLVKLPFSTPLFDSIIHFYNLEASFRDHLVSETNYSFIFNNQDIRKAGNFVYFRFNAETAGNILSGFSSGAGRPKESGYYKIFGTQFAQYVRSDIDLRYYRMLYSDNSLVYRIFAGAGLPYGNSTALPFEKKYFAGGANSIRAWQVRSLGPGSFNEELYRSFPNRTADIKLEANLEYRFNMFWLLEGALFMDAGNIWAIDYNDKRKGAQFRFGEFYKDIALGTGVGLRFDFSFFIFRLDMGLKLRDPAEPEGKRWVHLHRRVSYDNDVAFNIGIGYPF